MGGVRSNPLNLPPPQPTGLSKSEFDREIVTKTRRSVSKLKSIWKRITEVVILSCVILVVWGLFAIPTVFYALPPLQVS